jgi:hypothetical protein
MEAPDRAVSKDAEQLSDAVPWDQLAGLAAFRAELPNLSGRKRGFPEIEISIGIVTAMLWWAASARSKPATTQSSAIP